MEKNKLPSEQIKLDLAAIARNQMYDLDDVQYCKIAKAIIANFFDYIEMLENAAGKYLGLNKNDS